MKADVMFNSISRISRTRWLSTWFAAVAVISACSVVGGVPLTTSMAQLWLVGSLMPPAVMWLVWSGSRSVTMAEVLRAVDRSKK